MSQVTQALPHLDLETLKEAKNCKFTLVKAKMASRLQARW